MTKKNIVVLTIIPLIVISIFLAYFFFVHKYNVIIISDNVVLEVQAIKYNKTAKIPNPPVKENYEFEGWYIGKEKYDFSKPVHKNIKIEAKYRPVVLNIIIDQDYIHLDKNSTTKLNVIAEPKGAKANIINWYSEDSSIVSVSSDGVITAHQAGTTYVVATTNNGVSAKAEVTVNKILADSVEIKQKDLIINVGDEVNLSATISPDNTDSEYLKWTVSNEDILKISTNGKIKGLKSGKATVIVYTNNNKKDSINVTVKDVYPTNIKLNNISTTIGKRLTLKVNYIPKNTSVKKVVWSSSDTSIATVDSDGNIIGLRPGKVVISATTVNNKTSRATITFNSNTKNKKVLFVGDSITYGRNSTPRGYSWANYIGDNYDLKSSTNGGLSGATISKTNTYYLLNKMNVYKKNKYDYIILSGGTNDIHYSVALGSFDENDFSGKYNTKTFLGGLENYIYNAKMNWPDAKIGYIITYSTPHSSKNRVKLSARYYQEMRKVLDKWKIKYIDLYSGSNLYGVKYSNLLKVNTYKYLVDGLHLNREGYNVVAPHIYLWMNTL